VAQDGTVMHGLALIYVIRNIGGIRQFKVIQEGFDSTRVLLVTDPGFNAWEEETIRRGFRQRLGGDVRVKIEHVAAIPCDGSGKHRYVESRVTRQPRPKAQYA
jgi:phenylacetate-CoA ligase